jgi:uncharacterized membrane protein YfcA
MMLAPRCQTICGKRFRECVFIIVCLFLAIRLLVGKDKWRLGDGLPGTPAMTGYGLLIGSSASLMGIGGGLVANVVLTLHRFPKARRYRPARSCRKPPGISGPKQAR